MLTLHFYFIHLFFSCFCCSLPFIYSRQKKSTESCWRFPTSFLTLGRHQGDYFLINGLLNNYKSKKDDLVIFEEMLDLQFSLYSHRICKDDVITDFEQEVQKLKEVKLFSSKQAGVLQQIEQFLKVKNS